MNTIHQYINPSRELDINMEVTECNLRFAYAYSSIGFNAVDVAKAIENMHAIENIQESPKEKKKKYREGLNKMMNKGKKW
jgi:hypothetical protein